MGGTTKKPPRNRDLEQPRRADPADRPARAGSERARAERPVAGGGDVRARDAYSASARAAISRDTHARGVDRPGRYREHRRRPGCQPPTSSEVPYRYKWRQYGVGPRGRFHAGRRERVATRKRRVQCAATSFGLTLITKKARRGAEPKEKPRNDFSTSGVWRTVSAMHYASLIALLCRQWTRKQSHSNEVSECPP
jgi:hypothetical protein